MIELYLLYNESQQVIVLHGVRYEGVLFKQLPLLLVHVGLSEVYGEHVLAE